MWLTGQAPVESKFSRAITEDVVPVTSHQAFTYSKSTMEARDHCAKSAQSQL